MMAVWVSLSSPVVSLATHGQFITTDAAACQQLSTSGFASSFQFVSPCRGFRFCSFLAGSNDRVGGWESKVRVRVGNWKLSGRERGTGPVWCNSANRNGSSDAESGTAGGGDGAPFNPASNTTKLTSRRDLLMEYVKSVQPEFMEKFVKRAPDQVVDAMRQTVTNMLGTLPPQFFEITVSTVAENLAQLMYSVMMTGYMFRNAQLRLELQQSLSQVALPEPKDNNSPVYEPGVNKAKVAGEVVRWNKEDGPERIPAVEYIRMLESEIQELQLQLDSSRRASRGRNELLEYLKSLQPQNLQDLTSTAGEDALEAMNTFVTRLLGVKDPEQLKRAATETSAAELAKLLYWLMVVGYSIRNIEVRYDMERVLGMPVQHPKLAELSPGENPN